MKQPIFGECLIKKFENRVIPIIQDKPVFVNR
jgi:hypothetical protein